MNGGEPRIFNGKEYCFSILKYSRSKADAYVMGIRDKGLLARIVKCPLNGRRLSYLIYTRPKI